MTIVPRREYLNIHVVSKSPQLFQKILFYYTVKNDRLKQPKKIGCLSWSRTTRLK